MKVREFLKQVTDDGSVLRVLALDVIEGMSDVDFEELCMEMRYATAETWAERKSLTPGPSPKERGDVAQRPMYYQGNRRISEAEAQEIMNWRIPAVGYEHLLARGGAFHPTNRDND